MQHKQSFISVVLQDPSNGQQIDEHLATSAEGGWELVSTNLREVGSDELEFYFFWRKSSA